MEAKLAIYAWSEDSAKCEVYEFSKLEIKQT